MAVLYVSEADAVRDIASLLVKARTGTEIVIESEDSTVAVLMPPGAGMEEPEPGYDEWFRAEVQSALDDPRESIPAERVEALFAEKRRASLARIKDSDD
jgi:antitoxin (DNA-binding transcriptional repressor) of toxin-antitoxin stability system